MSSFPDSLAWLVAVTVVPSMLVSLFSLYPIRGFANRLGLLDRPGGHKSHTLTTPLGGGIGIWLGVTLTFAAGTLAVMLLRHRPDIVIWLPKGAAQHLDGVWSRAGQLWGVLGAGTLLVLIGLWDDRRGIHWSIRLGAQCVIAGFVVLGLGFGLTAYITVPWITDLLSVLWIVAVINSFNMLDNMDGLSGGVATIIAVSMAVVMLSTPDPGTAQPQLLVGSVLLVVAGALCGFLWHNWTPARIFMGDGGSYFVGFLIAVSMLMATFAGGGDSKPHAVLAPLCAMAVPLYDMSTVLWIRVREGRSPFEGDRRHFSHRLVELGLTRTQAVLTIYLVCGTCGLAAILLTHVSVWQAVAVLGIVACMLLLTGILESTGWRKRDA